MADITTDDVYTEIAQKVKENLNLDCQATGKRKIVYRIINFFRFCFDYFINVINLYIYFIELQARWKTLKDIKTRYYSALKKNPTHRATSMQAFFLQELTFVTDEKVNNKTGSI